MTKGRDDDGRLPSRREPDRSEREGAARVPARRADVQGRVERARIIEMVPRDEEEIALGDLWRILRRQWWVVACTLVLVMGAAGLYSWWKTPVWEASTLIRIETPGGDPFSNPFLGLGAEDEIETEMQVVSTLPIAQLVIDRIGLRFGVERPADLYPGDIFSAVRLDSVSPSFTYELARAGTNRWTIRTVETEEENESLAVAIDEPLPVAAGDPVTLPGVTLTVALDGTPRPDGVEVPEKVRFYTRSEADAIEEELDALTVRRPDPNASLFQISYRGTKRTLVPDVANAFATSFLDQRRTVKKTEARSTGSFLRDQAAELLTQLNAAEEELQTFREEEQVVALESEAQSQVERLAELETKRTGLVSERDALRNLLSGIDAASADGRPDYRRLVAFPTFLENRTIQNLVQALTTAEQQRTELRARWKPTHPGMQALDIEIHGLEDQLGAIGKNYMSSLSDQLASLDAVLARFGSDLETIPARELQYARLKRRTELLTDLYSMLETRLKETEISEAVEDPSARVVEPAVVPRRPVAPKPARNLALAGFLGLMAGLGLAFVRAQMDQTIHADDEVDDVLGVPVLSRVPPIEAVAGNGRGRRGGLVTHTAGRSLPAESFRALRTNVIYARASRLTREIIVTSPGAKDGKSTTASNLAVTFAQHGRKTLLVDADLRRSVQHAIFGIDRKPGLCDYLGGRVSLEEVVCPSSEPNLFIVPAGGTPSNPSELLGSPLMTYLIQHSRETYDAVIFDSPPVLAVTDAAVLAGMADGVLLVVRAGRTQRPAAKDAIEELRRVGATLLGVVVNDAEAGGRYGYRYRYYYDYYGDAESGTTSERWLDRLPLKTGR